MQAIVNEVITGLVVGVFAGLLVIGWYLDGLASDFLKQDKKDDQDYAS